MQVPLIDLRAQYGTMRGEIDRAVSEVLESQAFVLGPIVEAFEREVAAAVGVEHAVGCANGTDAIYLVLRALGLRPGDEVIVPAFTFFATAGAVWNAGLRPVFCDVDPATFNVTAESVDACWSDRTRAILPVHLFGQMAPMAELNDLAGPRGAFVLEDAAQAIGAWQCHPTRGGVGAGAAGAAGALSFFPTKNLGAFGDGGLVTTNDDALADRVRKLRVHGGTEVYHHDVVGVNSRLDAVQAAVLRAKLPRLDTWKDGRRANAALYDEALHDLKEVRMPHTPAGNHHVYNQYTIRASRRDELRKHLEQRGIGSGLYYPKPLHLQECFAELGYRTGDLPEAEAACREVLSLPVYPELGLERAALVAECVFDFYAKG